MGTMINACGFGTAKKYSEMTELEKAKADLDYAKRKGGFAYKQAVAHYKKVLKNSWKGAVNGNRQNPIG